MDNDLSFQYHVGAGLSNKQAAAPIPIEDMFEPQAEQKPVPPLEIPPDANPPGTPLTLSRTWVQDRLNEMQGVTRDTVLPVNSVPMLSMPESEPERTMTISADSEPVKTEPVKPLDPPDTGSPYTVTPTEPEAPTYDYKVSTEQPTYPVNVLPPPETAMHAARAMPHLALPLTSESSRPVDIRRTYAADDQYGQMHEAEDQFSEYHGFSHLNDHILAAITTKERGERDFRAAQLRVMRRALLDLADDDRRLKSIESAFEIGRETLTDVNI